MVLVSGVKSIVLSTVLRLFLGFVALSICLSIPALSLSIELILLGLGLVNYCIVPVQLRPGVL